MAKIKEIAGVIGETLRLSPFAIESHIRGLRAARRIESEEVGPREVADLLAACLCTDNANATAAFHLPFVGAECGGAIIEAFAEDLAPYRANAGQVLALHLDPKAMQFRCAERITIAGSGAALRMTIDGMSPCVGRLQLWFGYEMLPALANHHPLFGVFEARSVAGSALRKLGDALMDQHEGPNYRKFLQAAFELNSPNVSEQVTVH